MKNKQLFYIAILIFLYLSLLLFLPWRGFYLLNDDYMYFWSAINFVKNNGLLHPLVATTMLFQVILTQPIIFVFGDNPGVLRFISSIFYIAGVITFYFLIVKSDFFSKRGRDLYYLKAFVISLLLLFNPLYIYSGFTFLADIYYLACYIFFVLFLYNYLKKRSLTYLFLCSFALVFLFLSRQLGLFVFLGSVILLIIYRTKVVHLLIFSIPIVITFIFYQFFYSVPLGYSSQSISLTLSLLSTTAHYYVIFDRFIKTPFYIGLFLLPLSVPTFLSMLLDSYVHRKVRYLVYFFCFFMLFTIMSLYLWFYEKEIMFYIPNIISYAGFNPQNINDGVKQTLFVDSPLRVRAVITLLSIFSLSTWLVSLFRLNFRDLLIDKVFVILLFSTVFSFIPTIIFRDYFDRYLLIILPLILYTTFLTIRSLKREFTLIALVLCILFSLVWVLFEHDYLSLNKKMWEVTYNSSQYPMINPNNTHASFEYNNYFYLDKTFYLDDSDELFNRDYMREKIDNKYLISYTDTWVYCRAERVYYPSFISKDSRTKGYFHIMVKGSEPFDPIQCKDIIKQYNYEKTQGNSNNYN